MDKDQVCGVSLGVINKILKGKKKNLKGKRGRRQEFEMKPF